MAITPDNDPMKDVTSALVTDTVKAVGKKIMKKIEDSTVFVDPCPGPGIKIIKTIEKLKKKR